MIYRPRLSFSQWMLKWCLKRYSTEDWMRTIIAKQALHYDVESCSDESARRIRNLIHTYAPTHRHVVHAVRQTLHERQSHVVTEGAVAHFEQAYDLCGDSPQYAFALIRDALDGHLDSGISREQESLLIELEASRWITRKADSSEKMARPVFTYSPCVAEVVIKRPQDLSRIIELAQSSNWGRAEQLEGVLDGMTVPGLSEGML